jgi:hypothetical protein
LGTNPSKDYTPAKYTVIDGMTVDPLWDSIVTSGNLPVRKLEGPLDATRDTKSVTNDHHDES